MKKVILPPEQKAFLGTFAETRYQKRPVLTALPKNTTISHSRLLSRVFVRHTKSVLSKLTELEQDVVVRAVLDEAAQDNELTSHFMVLPTIYLIVHLIQLTIGPTPLLALASVLLFGVAGASGLRAFLHLHRNKERVTQTMTFYGLDKAEIGSVRRLIHRQRRRWLRLGHTLHTDSGFNAFMDVLRGTTSASGGTHEAQMSEDLPVPNFELA